MVKKATSIVIDTEIWKEVKMKCLIDGKEISGYLEGLIKKDLGKD
jgi:hypothetical protein